MLSSDTILHFDAFLQRAALDFEAIVVGGSALILLGIIDRRTRDCDVVHPELPPAIRRAAVDFARARREAGEDLDDHWLNNGPADLVRTLPAGWRLRLQPAYQGKAFRLMALGRGDLLKTKLFALCDRDIDLADCLAMAPTRQELVEAEPWVADQDGHPRWPKRVRDVLSDLERRLSDGL